jgi:hypothetical protein
MMGELLSRFAIRGRSRLIHDRLERAERQLEALETSMAKLEEAMIGNAEQTGEHGDEIDRQDEVLDEFMDFDEFADPLPSLVPSAVSGGLAAYQELFELQKQQLDRLVEMNQSSFEGVLTLLERLGFADARLQRKQMDNLLALMQGLGFVQTPQPEGQPQPEGPQPAPLG